MARKEIKAAEIEDLMKKIKDGTFETFRVNGVSKAWQKFSKIRNAANKLEVPYVYCRECQIVTSFRTGFGTSNLLKHDCNKTPDREQVFKKLPVEKVETLTKEFMMKAISFCAKDILHPRILSNPGFLEFAQFAVTFGDKYGSVNVEDLIPHPKSVQRKISEITDQASQKLFNDFRISFEQNRCSATIQVWYKQEVDAHQLLSFRLHYFNANLTAICKKSIFTIGIDDKEIGNGTKISQRIIQQFKVFGGVEDQLKKMIIVTPSIPLMDGLTFLVNRHTCAVYRINEIFDSVFDSTTEGLLSNCRGIVQYFLSHKKSHLLDSRLDDDIGTWESRILMIESVSKQYDAIMTVLDEDNRYNFIVQNRTAKEMVFIFKPFIEAIQDLKSNESTSCSKIVLWWATLNTHLQSEEMKGFSFEGKQAVSRAKFALQEKFYPTMEDKISCFLDPQYRSLNMFSNDTERLTVFDEVRRLLEVLPATNVHTPSASGASRHPDEDSQPQPQRKKSRFAKYTTTTADVGTNDEVKMYIQYADVSSVDFDSEFDIVEKFWKPAKDKYPKLFQMAMTRLHVGVTCEEDENCQQKIKPNDLHNLMVLRDDFD